VENTTKYCKNYSRQRQRRRIIWNSLLSVK